MKLARHVLKNQDKLIAGITNVTEVEDDLKVWISDEIQGSLQPAGLGFHLIAVAHPACCIHSQRLNL